MRTLSITTAALLLSASAALAAPCATDKAKSPNDGAANQQSSDVDKSSKNTAGGNQPASPGTVGALNALGPNQGVTGPAAGEKSPGEKSQAGKEDPAAKNTAGGDQPASPATVGAMNNAQKTQNASNNDGC